MAEWTKNKVNASDVNSGNQFNAGDGVRNTDINKIFESGLYSQDVVENIGIGTVTTGSSGSSASASVTYNASGYPRLNLTLPKGDKGDKGDSGDVGTLSELLFAGQAYDLTNMTNTPSFTPSHYLVEYAVDNRIYGSVILCLAYSSPTEWYAELPYCNLEYTGYIISDYIRIYIYPNTNRVRCYDHIVSGNITNNGFVLDTENDSTPSIKVYALKF